MFKEQEEARQRVSEYLYDTLRENRENIIEAFNACFPDSAIPA
jgi:hypothetical protein